MSITRTFVACVIAAAITAPAYSQDRPKGDREKMPAEGKLIGMARGMLRVKTEDEGEWFVAVGRGVQEISVVGQAEASWLRPGMLVRFTGNFNRKGEAVAPIKELSVVTMREGMRFGMALANPPSRFGGSGGGLFADADEEEKKAKPKRAKKLKPEDIAYTVVGRIAKIRKGEYSIVAGRLLKFELDEKPRIDVDVADLTLVPQGASITLDAWYLPNQPGRAMANKISVTLEKPLAAKEKPRRGVSVTTSNRSAETNKAGAAGGEEDAKNSADEKDDEKKDDEKKDDEDKKNSKGEDK
jgi:hypothetical protein